MSGPDEPQIVDAEIIDDPAPAAPATDYTDAGVPNFDYVRDRIEGRYATSVGSTELAAATPEGQSVDEQLAERERAGKKKLEQIRKAMRGE